MSTNVVEAEDGPSSGATTPENDPNNSLLNKVRCRVSSILPNSLTKWFTQTNRNGRRRRQSDSEEESEEHRQQDDRDNSNRSTGAGSSNNNGSGPPPIKRPKVVLNDSDPLTNRRMGFTYATTPITTTSSAIENRRKLLGVTNQTGTPYRFSNYNNAEQATTDVHTIDDSTEEELDDDDMQFSLEDHQSANVNTRNRQLLELSNRRQLNISPIVRNGPVTRTMPVTTRNSYLSSFGGNAAQASSSSSTIQQRPSPRIINDTNLELNGNENDTSSESGESSAILPFPNCPPVRQPQLSSGNRTRTVYRDDEESSSQRRLSGLFSNVRSAVRGHHNASGGLNFATHLQSHKSLFSDKNMPNSLNNSTTSLTSLNRRQSFNASIYGSTSALSDSRLLNTTSPFYNGRTMYGGASAYSRRANVSQRVLRVPTQMRPSSSLSNLSSPTNSTVAADTPETTTPALSNTAKRILDLMNQFTTPLADVKKMANAQMHVPALVAHRKRFDEMDMAANRSIRMQNPKTPYTRSGGKNPIRIPAMSNELQVPSMSQLLQMKKVLQNNTEKVRELAAGSQSILNKTPEYHLPDVSTSDKLDAKRKIRNKITSTRIASKQISDETVEPVKLPNIQLEIKDTGLGATIPNTSIATNVFSSTVVPFKPVVTSTVLSPPSYKLSTPICVIAPSLANSAQPINNFKFSEPIYVNNSVKSVPKLNNSITPNSDSPKRNSPESKTLSPDKSTLKAGSVLDALSKPVTMAAAPLPSLNTLFKPKTNQWECTSCMLLNDTSKMKCVACESPKPAGASSTLAKSVLPPKSNSFGSQFKPSSSSWECGTCMIRNKEDAHKCIACETPKPGSIKQVAASLSMPSSTKPLFGTVDQGFKNIVAQQSSRWECSACLTRNDALRKKCECCELERPNAHHSADNAAAVAAPAFSFGNSTKISEPKFSFGVPFNKDLNKSTGIEINSTATTAAAAAAISSTSNTNFVFGTVAANTIKTNTQVDEVSGNRITAATPINTSISSTSKPDSVPTFFGHTTEKKPEAISSPLSGFKFGVTNIKTQPLTFANTGVTTTSITTIATTPSTITAAVTKLGPAPALSGFKFGVPQNTSAVPPQQDIKSTTAFTFGVPSAAKSVDSTSNKKPEFNVGSNISTPAATQETRPVAAPVTNQLFFGLNTTTSTPTVATTTVDNKTAASNVEKPPSNTFTFGGAAQQKSTEGFAFGATKPTPNFGGEATAPQPLALPFGTIGTMGSPKSTFVFGGSAATNNETSSTTSSNVPTFGSNNVSQNNNTTPANNFFTQNNNASPFGGGGGAAAANSTSLFGQSAGPSNSAFAFNATTSVTSVAPTFGQTTVATAPAAMPSFGQPQLPSFGAFANATATPPTFGTQQNTYGINNASPFGTSSPFNQQSAAPPTFGSAGAFGAPNSTSNLTFGGTPTPTGFMTPNCDEPQAKKVPTGVFSSPAGGFQKSPAFSFGATPAANSSEIKMPFSFSTATTPSFNFSSQQAQQQQSTMQPYTYGVANIVAPNASVFNFGSGTAETPSNAPFQFAAETTNTNIFSPQPTGPNVTAAQQRRKIRAVRRTIR